MKAIVTGGASGLGQAIRKHLTSAGHNVDIWDIQEPYCNDVGDLVQTMNTARLLGPIDLLVNAAGVNYIEWFEMLKEKDFTTCLRVNTAGIYNCTKALLPNLTATGGTVCNILSNASHIPMTATTAYCTSKAAAYMLTRQLAHELFPKYGITVFGVSPNKLAGTSMAAYTAEQVAKVRGWSKKKTRKKQLKALPIGEETPVEVVAEFVAWLLTEKYRHKYLHGCIIPYGGPDHAAP